MNIQVDNTQPFDKDNFPSCNDSRTVVMIQFTASCDETLTIRLAKIINHGNGSVPNEAIWLIESRDTATRVVRLFKGEESLRYLVLNCGFLDKNECVHTGKGELSFGSLKYDENIPFVEDVLRMDGVQQGTNLTRDKALFAGRCWFSAMCWSLFFNKDLKYLFISKFPPDISKLVETCLSDPEAAEALRVYCSTQLSAGDEIDIELQKEGRNGFTEATTIITKLGISLIRFIALPSQINFNSDHRAELHLLEDDIIDRSGQTIPPVQMANDQTCLLAVRCFRTNWRPKRRINHGGRRFYLASAMIGSEHCGHQIGLSTCDYDDATNLAESRESGRKGPRIARWSVSDSDSIRKGISPTFWRIKRMTNESSADFSKRWWKAWGEMIPVTIFRNRTTICDLSSHNRPTGELQCKIDRTSNSDLGPGVVNSDFIYVSFPNH